MHGASVYLENPCNRRGPGGRVDGPRPEPVGVVRPRRVVGLAADELGDGGRGLLLAGGAAAPVVVIVGPCAGGAAAGGRGAEEGGGGVLGAEEVGSVVRHAAGAVTGRRRPSPWCFPCREEGAEWAAWWWGAGTGRRGGRSSGGREGSSSSSL